MSCTNTCMGVYEFTQENKRMFNLIIKPLIETHTGLTYIDALSHYEPLFIKMDLITRQIEEANILVVDISSKNPNVFIELGIAYALKKPMVLICSERSFYSKDKDCWSEKIPFDIRSRELLIFRDDNDLKVMLSRSISDCLFKTKTKNVSWCSENKNNHIKSASEFEIFEHGNIWSNIGISSSFTLSYRVQIHNSDYIKNPDIRLFFSSSLNGYPRIVIIFPWEHSEINMTEFECHIDYFKANNPGEFQENHLRLQQRSVGQKSSSLIRDFNVFVSFCWPNLVFESTIFEDKVKRLLVPISQLRDLGYPIHLSQFIGFEAINNSNVTIDNIIIKEILS